MNQRADAKKERKKDREEKEQVRIYQRAADAKASGARGYTSCFHYNRGDTFEISIVGYGTTTTFSDVTEGPLAKISIGGHTFLNPALIRKGG